MTEYSNFQVRAAIDEWVHSERDRRILIRRLIDGITYERLAEEVDMSVRQVKAIVYRLQETVFSHLQAISNPYRHRTEAAHDRRGAAAEAPRL